MGERKSLLERLYEEQEKLGHPAVIEIQPVGAGGPKEPPNPVWVPDSRIEKMQASGCEAEREEGDG